MTHRWIAFAMVSALMMATAAAQERPEVFPTRSIKIVVPFPAGGPSDVLARMIGARMGEDWGQPVVVENRPGANTVLGAQQVAKSAPDGYTLLMAIDSTLTMNQYLYRTPPYDPFNDFAPITLTAKTMQVPYNGSAEVAQGVLTRSVDFSFDGPSASLSLIQSGAFRALAKFDPRPFPPVPDLPIITAELPKMDEITVWLGLVAPKDTPPAIVDKLQAEVAKILADPAIKAKADASGLFPATSTPAEFSAFIRKEAQRWSAVVKETGMKDE